MSSESSSIQNLSGDKLLSFAIGQQKKSRFQKEREDKELKRKQDEEDAAKVFKSFAASFNADEDDGHKRFVQAGENLDARSVEEKPAIRANQKLSEMDKMMLELKDNEKAQDGEREERRQRRSSFDIPISSSSAKKTRNMDEMLDEFKFKHDNSSSAKSFELPEVDYSARDVEKGSFDTGDPYTTNLHVGNINPATTEEHLTSVFAPYGEINSVKIMWPRSEEERARNRNTGFVSFKHRADADAARRELDKSILAGHALIVGWGKAVKVSSSAPIAPIVLSTNFANLANAAVYAHLAVAPSAAAAPHSNSSRWDEQPRVQTITLQVHLPTDNKLKATIDIIANYVAADGEAFEKKLMQREANNSFFNFLYPPGHSHYSHELHLYYRWRVYANLMSYERSHDQAFQMVVNGPWIQPPMLPANGHDKDEQEEEGSLDGRRSRSRSSSVGSSDNRRRNNKRRRSRSPSHDRYKDMTGAQIERVKDKERLARRARLNKDDYEAFKDLLRNLTLSRVTIKQSMGFAFDHIEHAEDIINIIKDKLIKSSSYPAVKIAGLYLLSDILHNSASPIKYATNYRIQIEKCIPEVIEHISLSLRAATGRMSALAIEERVKKVLSAWETWSIFPERFLLGLEIIFMMNETDLNTMQTMPIDPDTHSNESEEEVRERTLKKAKALGIAVTEVSSVDEIMRKIAFVEMKIKQRQEPLTTAAAFAKVSDQQQQLQPETEQVEEDIDGAPLLPQQHEQEEDVDGQPMEIDNDDIDGVPLTNNQDSEDIDGAPMHVEDDVDGIPMEDEDIDGVPLA